MAGYTVPDGLEYPDNYSDPADVPTAVKALADSTQAALDTRVTDVESDGFVKVVGDEMTGSLTIRRYTAASIDLNLDAQYGQARYVTYRAAGVVRWQLQMSQSDDFNLLQFNGSGVYRWAAWSVNSGTGEMTLGVPTPTVDAGVASKGYVDTAVENVASRTGEVNLGLIKAGEDAQATITKTAAERCFITVNHPSTYIIATAQEISATTVRIEARNSTVNTDHTDVKIVWAMLPV